MSYIRNYDNDPIFKRMMLQAEQNKKLSLIPPDSGGDSGDTPPKDSTKDVTIYGPGEYTYTPQYAPTPEYGLAMRGAQVAADFAGAVGAGVQYGTTLPVEMQAQSRVVETVLGNAPAYVSTPTSSQGPRTQVGGFDPSKSYVSVGNGVITEYDPAIEDYDGGKQQANVMTSAEAALKSPAGYTGPDIRTPEGLVQRAVMTALAPANPITATLFGPTVETGYGNVSAQGGGIFGAIGAQQIKQTHEVLKNVEREMPGNFSMTLGNKTVTYQDKDGFFGTRTARVTGNVRKEEFERLYAGALGHDPRNVDWQNSTQKNLKGGALTGYVPGVGGVSPADGAFINSRGVASKDLTNKELETYVTSLGTDPDRLAGGYRAMKFKAEMATKPYQKSKYQTQADNIFNQLTAREQNLERQERSAYSSKGPRYTLDYDSSDRAGGDSATSVGGATIGGQNGGLTGTFAEGGRVVKSEGEMVGQESEEMGPVGFVNGRSPEEVTDADTVKDDVEGTVPEGTFVISGASVERYGSERIRKLLISALQEAERQGIDISASGSTITDEDSVSVAVSEGEVLVPPVLVRIIGLEKLEKINALGQEEVDERVEEYGQAEASEPVEGEAPVQASVEGGFAERQKKAEGDLVKPLNIVLGKSGKIDNPEYLDSTFEEAFRNMMRNRRAVEESIQQKIRTDEPAPPLEDIQKQLRQIHQQYQDDMKEIQRVSDPYVFQEYMRTHTDASADYLNAIEGFGEKEEKSTLTTDNYLSDLAKMRVSIPIGSQDDFYIPTGNHYGITFRESSAGDKAKGYTHGFASKSTSPASTGFHEAGHISLRDKEKANPLYKGIDGAFVYRRKNEDGKIIDGAYLTEEEMMRVHDMFRSLSSNNRDAYNRARNFISRNPDSNFGNYLENKTDKEVESVVYDIVYGALTNDYFGEHEVKQSFAKQRLPRPQ